MIDDLPGYPDNINRASDGNYWMALVGMRTPALDLAWRCPASAGAWPSACRTTNGCSPTSTPAACSSSTRRARSSRRCGTSTARNHPMITSMREHKGYLYLGGIYNNRIGRYKIPGADPDFVQYDSLGSGSRDRRAARLWPTDCSAAARRRSPSRSSTARSSPTSCSRMPRSSRSSTTPEDLASDGDNAVRSPTAHPSLRLPSGDRAAAVAQRSTRRSPRLPCLPDGGLAVGAGRPRGASSSAAPHDGKTMSRVAGTPLHAVNALACRPAMARCCVTDGSAQHRAYERWTHDLMERGRSGPVCRDRSRRPAAPARSPAGWPIPSAIAVGSEASGHPRAGATALLRLGDGSAAPVSSRLAGLSLAAGAGGRRRILAHLLRLRARSSSNSCCARTPIATA